MTTLGLRSSAIASMAIVAMIATACGGAPATAPAGATSAVRELPTSSPAAPGQPTDSPTDMATDPGPPVNGGGDSSVTVALGRGTFEFEDIRQCDVSSSAIGVEAQSADGLGVLIVTGDPATPLDMLISIARLGEFGYAYTSSTGGPAPAVSVSGESVEIEAQVYTGTAEVGDRDTANIRIRCAEEEPVAVDTPAPDGGSAGSATVEIGGQTYELVTGEPPVCSLAFGVQASMASADRTTSLDVYQAGSVFGLFLLARPLAGELWMPSDDPKPPFTVSGSSANWSGTLRNSEDGLQEQATISIQCAPD